ncbi:nuclear transport factor 2 family protein [Paraburkholderia sp. J12]|uniref:nuclear transport factor 2 family protein n=1 Tax=Paraburkholderia sp. J12 TaxID=2805432 RepID=UPI002ABE8176|nr:nuclear transport factor 2 family protein [Paraburkholderia sp. J12]
MNTAAKVWQDPAALDVVQAFWRLMGTNDFYAVEAVLARDFVLEWPQSNERIRGATNFARLNTAYPAQGPWVFTINRMVANENEVVSDVDVTDGVLNAKAISFFTIEQGKITRMVEFWPELYEAPFDRTAFVEPIK